jgi:group I intron endonuclease
MVEKVYGIVYKVTNLVDGKIYIGQTVQTLWRRRRAHENLSAKPETYFHRALAKHGFDNFTWEIVDSCESKEDLHAREQHWIDHCACMAPVGYNSAEGGKGGAYLESHKRRISEALKGRAFSAETRRKMSVAMQGRKPSEKLLAKLKAKTGQNNHFFGKTHSKETRRLIGEKSKGRNWATGEKAPGWSDADRSIILECYFQKCTDKEMIAVHLDKTGRKINRKALCRVFRELGLHISESRGKRAAIERRAFIDSNDVSVFRTRLLAFIRPSDERAPDSLPTFDAMTSRPEPRPDSNPENCSSDQKSCGNLELDLPRTA